MVRRWEAQSGKPLGAPLPHTSQVDTLAFSPAGLTLGTGCTDHTARLWTRTPRAVARHRLKQTERFLYDLACSPDRRTLATAGSQPWAILWDLTTGEEALRMVGHAKRIQAVAFSHDGRTVLTGGLDGDACVWNVATGELRRRFPLTGEVVRSVALGPKGKTVLASAVNGSVWLGDVETGTVTALAGHGVRTCALAFSPEGSCFLTGGADRTARLWHAATRDPRHNLPHPAEVQAAAFSPDGRTVATAAADFTAQLWDVASGKPLGPPLEHQAEIRALAFSPDGRTLLTGCQDQTAQLWDMPAGKRRGPPLHYPANVVAGHFSPDGLTVWTGLRDGTIHHWEVPPPRPGTPGRVRHWAQVVIGMELQEHGAFRVLDAAAWALLKAHQGRDQFRGQTEAERLAWLRQIMARHLANVLRCFGAAGRDVDHEVSLEDLVHDSSLRAAGWLADSALTPAGQAARHEDVLRLAAALEQLPEDQRQAVELRHLRGTPLAEVADQMGRSKRAVAGLLYRGLQKLRGLLEPDESG